jgi:hypothetical protein
MTRRPVALLLLAVALLLPACGKYGPPQRVRPPPPAQPSQGGGAGGPADEVGGQKTGGAPSVEMPDADDEREEKKP